MVSLSSHQGAARHLTLPGSCSGTSYVLRQFYTPPRVAARYVPGARDGVICSLICRRSIALCHGVEKPTPDWRSVRDAVRQEGRLIQDFVRTALGRRSATRKRARAKCGKSHGMPTPTKSMVHAPTSVRVVDEDTIGWTTGDRTSALWVSMRPRRETGRGARRSERVNRGITERCHL